MKNLVCIVLTVVFSIPLSYRLVLAQKLVKCAYFGEPHLIPFPLTFGGIQNTYLCLSSGTEVLLSNSFLTITVNISPVGGHPIISVNKEIDHLRTVKYFSFSSIPYSLMLNLDLDFHRHAVLPAIWVLHFRQRHVLQEVLQLLSSLVQPYISLI